MRQLHFNGKFYSGGLNGVHRVADRLILEVDRLLAASGMDFGGRPPLLHLPVKRQWEPKLEVIRLAFEKGGHSQLWEQAVLPRRAKGGVLVNLCNLAPIFHRRKLLMLHDAQFLFPDSSYPARLRWGYRLLTPLMARTSAQVLTVSEYSRQTLDLCGVSPRSHTTVLHNGADHIIEVAPDPAALQTFGLTDRCYAVHIASPKAYKNSQVIFAAFDRPELADVTLALVGPDRRALERAGLKPPPGAVFCGRIDDAGLRALYESALCLLFPSRTEGFGLPPIEAMACGCPAVVAPSGAIPEVCRDAALYADVDDPKSWASAMQKLRAEPALRDEKVRLGRTRAGDFTWAAAGRGLLDAILAAAGSPD